MDVVYTFLPCLLVSSVYLTNFVSTTSQKSSCALNSCHPTKDGYVNVHILAHTHNDVGWIETANEYYTVMVEPILTSTLQSLQKNKNRRFMYVESIFLFKWWNEQSYITRNQFKELINNGQLELVSGGWSMNDEATTNYQSIIDQFTLGLSKINETFGVCGRPKVGWQIDTFGHSREMASIFAQLGFDGLFLGRVDYQDKAIRFKNRTAEIIWQGSENLGRRSDIFTTILYNLYLPPPGMCYDLLCNNVLKNSHLEYAWNKLVKFMNKQIKVYRTNNIILTMGGDFHYSNAETWFGSLDKLIKYGNEKQINGSKYHLIYSTPSCYLKAVHEEAAKLKISWPIMKNDFFPYATNGTSYWAGLYTSRPSLKRLERIGNNYLQICKQMHVLANLQNDHQGYINPLKEAMGTLQHHDAITGTEQQHVADDYATSISKGIDSCETVTYSALNTFLAKHGSGSYHVFPFSSCFLSNTSQCTYTEKLRKFVITIYNPLSRTIDYYARIPVTEGLYSVRGPNGEEPVLQMIPISQQVLNIAGRKSNATFELVFKVVRLPPLGFKSYYVRKYSDESNRESVSKQSTNKKSSIKFGKDGLLSEVTMNGKTVAINQEFLYYQGRHSGAYIFLPKESEPTRISSNAKIEVHDGNVVKEIHQIFNEWVSQIIRVYPDENFIELQWLVGPLPQDGIPSVEVISRFTTDLNSQSTFYTDSNGRQMQKRVRNSRPTWQLNVTQPVAGNYYPVTSKILIRDTSKDIEVAVLTDRSQGGTSLKDGQIELMVHRTTMQDDSGGVAEPLQEQAFGKPLVVRGSHYLVVGPYLNGSEGSAASIEKDIAQRKLLEAWTFISPPHSIRYDRYKRLYNLEYSGLRRDLPKNVQLLSLEPLDEDSILLRLEHVFEKNEDPVWSIPVDIDLEELFVGFKVVDLRETTLGGNQWLEESRPMTFELKEDRGNGSAHTPSHAENQIHKFVITLSQMQIRTFVVKIQRNWF